MVDAQLQRRRYGTGVVSLLSGLIIFWTALHSAGSDWFISETHADIIYTGLRRFGQFPFFSFVFNGGAYFLQDPQSNLFSPTVPLILLAGPTVGLRLMEASWGVLGVWAFTAWMSRRVSTEAALLGAVASVMSLGVLWKVSVGNDMFLWHLGLPALLWAVERVMRERTVQSALLFGLVLGLLLLGPTFHSFTYLFLPVVPLFVLLEWAFHRPKLAELARTIALFGAACALALLIASPKLVCWAKFPMSRPVNDAGVIGLDRTISSLFDYSATKFSFVQTSYVDALGRPRHSRWGLEECAVALPPIATLLALAGVLSPIWSRAKRPSALLAFVVIAAGVALTCCWPIWKDFRALTGGNFRVAPRFLGMAAFGLAMFAALGADLVLPRLRRAAFPVALAIIAVMFGSALWWTHTAAQFAGQSVNDTIHPDAINPFKTSREERAAVAGLKTFTELTELDGSQRSILAGVGYRDGFIVVGNDFKPNIWKSKRPQPIVVEGIDPGDVTVEHLRIKLNHIAPHARVVLRAREPAFGLSVLTQPPNALIDVHQEHRYLILENRGDAPIDRVILRAQLPISALWFAASILAVLAAISALVLLERDRRRKGAALLTGANLLYVNE